MPRGCRRRRRRTTRLRRGGAQALGSSLRRRRRPPPRARAERGSARTTVTRLRTARSRVGVRRAGTGLLSHRSSFPGRDAGQSPSPAMTPVNLLYLLPTPCHRPASSSPVLAVLLPTPRRRPTSSACSPLCAASLLLPTPCLRSGSSSSGAAVLVDARVGSYQSDTGKRERVRMEGQHNPASPLFGAQLWRPLETKIVS
jgi:hypothetical protein